MNIVPFVQKSVINALLKGIIIRKNLSSECPDSSVLILQPDFADYKRVATRRTTFVNLKISKKRREENKD